MVRIMPLLLVTSLVLTGCSDNSKWVGQWEGKRQVITPPGGDPTVAASLANIHLTIKANGTFQIQEESFNKGGSASFSGDQGTLTIKTMLERPIQSLGPDAMRAGGTRQLTFQGDGTIKLERDGFDPVVLRKGTSEAQ